MQTWLAKYVPRGSVVLSITTFGSYAMGLVRDRILAQTFGASSELDSYNAAFLVPDFLFNLLVASGIAAAVVPLFTELYHRERQHAYDYINTLLVAAVGAMVVTGASLAIFAPGLSYLVAPGLEPGARELVVQLMRIVAFSPIIFAASNALGAMLVAKQRFFLYGAAPLMYNVGIISGAVWLAPRFGIAGVAYGTLLGAGLHLVVRVIDALRSGWRPGLAFAWRTPAFRTTLRLMLPKMVGHPVELTTFWVFTSLASLLSPGAISVLNFARNFQSVPVSLLGIAMATAVFPGLAAAALVSMAELRQLFRRTAFSIVAVSTAAALVMYVIRRPLVALLLGGGAFDADDVARTALTLGVFCLAIPTESVSHLVARAWYATQNTVVPVIFSVVSLAVAGSSAYVLMSRFGIVGLPLGFFCGSLVKAAGLWLLFERRMQRSY